MFDDHSIEIHHEREDIAIDIIIRLLEVHANFRVDRKYGITTNIKFTCENSVFEEIRKMLEKISDHAQINY